MKKRILITILLFAITFGTQIQAQTPQVVSRPLMLRTVHDATPSDTLILVRGTDKIVRQMPLSEIGSGSSTLQGLQSVLDTGNDAESDNGSHVIDIFLDDTSPKFETNFYNSEGSEAVIKSEIGETYISNLLDDVGGRLNLTEEDISLTKNHKDKFGNKYYSTLDFKTPIGNNIYSLPAKTGDNSATPRTLTTSVNGNYADSEGNITISAGRDYIPLSGTEVGSPVTGDIEFEDGIGISLSNNIDVNSKIFYDNANERTTIITNKDGFEFYFDQRLGSNTSSNPILDTDFVQKKYVDDNFEGKPTSFTVATLPVGTLGDRAIVTDATAPIYLGTLTGGGSVTCPVWFNGTNWVSR